MRYNGIIYQPQLVSQTSCIVSVFVRFFRQCLVALVRSGTALVIIPFIAEAKDTLLGSFGEVIDVKKTTMEQAPKIAWWLNLPSWKICLWKYVQKWIISPKITYCKKMFFHPTPGYFHPIASIYGIYFPSFTHILPFKNPPLMAW